MARKNKKVVEEDFGMDEVDAFHDAKEKILLESAAGAIRNRYDDEFSDEEVMNNDSDSEDADLVDDDDAEYFGKKDEIAELQKEADAEDPWGKTKQSYYGADEAEDEETAKEIEEEALRLQKKHLQELNMDDYVDEDMDEEWTKVAKKHDLGEIEHEEEEKQSLKDLSKLDLKTKTKLINTSHPEFIPLTKELTKWTSVLNDLKSRQNENEVLNVKFTALSAYLGSISSYLALFIALIKEDEPFSMKEHPVMESILSSKELWRQANELDEEVKEEEKVEEQSQEKDMEMEENSDSGNEEFDSASEEVSESEEEEEEDSDLDIDISKPRILNKAKAQDIEDFVEGDIADVDAEEKKKRKKTLRFYTSKIDQQAKKKDERYTGDVDIPYKERLFERQQRLIEEARKRGLNDKNGADLDDNDSFDEDDKSNAKDVNDGFDESYYDTIKKERSDNKANRLQAHKDAVKAAKEGKLAELKENIGESGKRALNFQILKNKGLTPHRKKENRNSRVKKRLKYEKAQKKLKSVRSVYSAPTGAYEGEKTGIKKGLSKSVKF